MNEGTEDMYYDKHSDGFRAIYFMITRLSTSQAMFLVFLMRLEQIYSV